MDIIKAAIKHPVPVLVGVIFIILFGLLGLKNMPYQLAPSVVEPVVSVTTVWNGASPYEIEREIIEEQEDVLKGIPGLIEMESAAYNSRGRITLNFRVGTEINDVLLRVANKLDEVRSYPDGAEKPYIRATGASDSPIAWFVLHAAPENPRSIYTYRTFFENEIRQYLERIEGVSDLFYGGGTEQEMHIIVQPEKLAAHGLTISDLIAVLEGENATVSAGTMGVGRREYRVRTVGEFNSPAEIESIVIKSTGQKRLTVGDVARVEFGYANPEGATFHNGREGLMIGLLPETGANVLEVTDRAEKVVKWLNEEKLKPQQIYFEWVNDQRPYIRSAIQLVKNNILIGGALAIIVLLIFLRSVSATLVVASAIPISAIGTFIFMNALGRSLNVVSLAGISFAVGMLVDNAIVVLENIDRHRKMGKTPFSAAYDGAKEVWGAVLASTLTTVAVFLPVVFIQQEAGQLFKDIALAVTCAVIISLAVSVTVIPMLANKLFGLTRYERRRDRVGLVTRLGQTIAKGIMAVIRQSLRNWVTRLVTILILTSMAVLLVVTLFPKMEYMPQGNRNFVINLLIPPPGTSYQERREIGLNIYNSLEPYFEEGYEGLPGIRSMFYIGADRIMLFGIESHDEERAGEMVPILRRTLSTIPGVLGVSMQVGIFQTRMGRGRTIDVDVSGPDLDRLVEASGTLLGAIKKEIPDTQIRPVPSLELLFPEVNILPDRDRLKAVGMSAAELGVALDVLMDGRTIGEFTQEGQKKIDLVLKASAKDISTPEELYGATVVTRSGDLVPVFSLAKMERSSGINQIRHLEQERTFTLQVTPPKEIPMEVTMETIEEQIIPALKAQGQLEGISVHLGGTADKLTQTRKAIQGNFLIAALITYLLMSALFGNFLYPVTIMFTVPLAAAGGFLGLKLVNIFLGPQPLDILTMLGFVILIGVVVNNAILIVHQSLNNVRLHGMEHREAVTESVRTRLRPIYMSATTSIFGMLPLVVAPGPGSELYRGLGSVVLGGIALSTIFTVFVIPSLLLFFIRMEKGGQKKQKL